MQKLGTCCRARRSPERRAARRRQRAAAAPETRAGLSAISHWPAHLLHGNNLGPALRQGVGSGAGKLQRSLRAATQGARGFGVSASVVQAPSGTKREQRRAIGRQLKARGLLRCPGTVPRLPHAPCSPCKPAAAGKTRSTRPQNPGSGAHRLPGRADRLCRHDCDCRPCKKLRKTRQAARRPSLTTASDTSAGAVAAARKAHSRPPVKGLPSAASLMTLYRMPVLLGRCRRDAARQIPSLTRTVVGGAGGCPTPVLHV